MYSIYKKDNLAAYVGEVTKINSFERDGKKTIVVTLKDFAENTLDFFFANGDSDDDLKARRADVVEKLKLKESDFICIVGVCSDESKGTATGIKVLRRGRTKIGDFNIFGGVAFAQASNNENVFSVSMPYTEYKDGQEHKKRIQISFWNNEKRNRADNVRKVFSSEESKFCFCLTSPIKAKEYNGKTYESSTGYSLSFKSNE